MAIMTLERAKVTVPVMCGALWKEAAKLTCWAAKHGCLDSTAVLEPAAGLCHSFEEQRPAVELQPLALVLYSCPGSSATWSAEPPLPQSLSASGECDLMLRSPTLLLRLLAPPVQHHISSCAQPHMVFQGN